MGLKFNNMYLVSWCARHYISLNMFYSSFWPKWRCICCRKRRRNCDDWYIWLTRSAITSIARYSLYLFLSRVTTVVQRNSFVFWNDAVFLGGSGILYKICTPKLCFSNDQLHIILNRRNLEICEHSSFFQVLTKNYYCHY